MNDLEKLWPRRWTKLNPHPTQIRMISDDYRFKVVSAGRRSGKTERAKRKLITEAFRKSALYFFAAPTRQQVKDIYWKDLKSMVPKWFSARPPSESELVVFLKNGSEIHLESMDRPERIEGQPWRFGVIDEIDNCKPDAWYEHIRPAFDTKGLNTGCILIGVPEGRALLYELFESAKTDPEWGYYTWPSADILDAKVIENAKRDLSPMQFRQEYEASFELGTGRVYGDYSEENHTEVNDVDPSKPVLWCHDFNFSPMSSAVGQEHDNSDGTRSLYFFDEIVLESAVARQSAIEFVGRYKGKLPTGHLVKIYGDASGRVGEKHGQISNYLEVEKVLREAGFRTQLKVPKSNPAIKDRQNSLRAKILNARGERTLFVNPKTCKYINKGLNQLQFKEGSLFQEEEIYYQHITTAIGYLTAVEFPVRREKKK